MMIKALIIIPVLLFGPAVAGVSTPVPRPETFDLTGKYGCKIDEINDSRTVDARDINLPPHRWDVKVWQGKWSAWLPKHNLSRQAALKSCDQWMKAIEKELRQEMKLKGGG